MADLLHHILPRHAGGASVWRGDATSVVEFLRPLSEQLDAPGVLEICLNRPGELLVESADGWRSVAVPDMTIDRCLSLATAVATFCDQQINQERPLLSATLPSGERVQFVIPPAVPRGTVSITLRKPASLIKGLHAFEQDGLFERTACAATINDEIRPFEAELIKLKAAHRYADFLRHAVRERQTIVVSGRTGSGKTTFMKGLIEEVPQQERLITIQDTAELTLPHHPNVVHLFYSKGDQGTARVTARSLLEEACLRMRPDRIFLAEVRGEECFQFIRLAASGHPGSITSVHAGSCALAIEQMALMIRESGAGGGMTMDEVKRLLCLVIDIIVQFDRDERGRFISEIHYAPRARRLAQLRDQPGSLP